MGKSDLSPPDWRLQWRAYGHWLRSSCHCCIYPAWPWSDTRRFHHQRRSTPSHHHPPVVGFWAWSSRGSDLSTLAFSSYHCERQMHMLMHLGMRRWVYGPAKTPQSWHEHVWSTDTHVERRVRAAWQGSGLWMNDGGQCLQGWIIPGLHTLTIKRSAYIMQQLRVGCKVKEGVVSARSCLSNMICLCLVLLFFLWL